MRGDSLNVVIKEMKMQRNENETFEDYCARRAAANKATKEALKPKLFHDSNTFGTFVNKAKRAIKAERAARKAQRKV